MRLLPEIKDFPNQGIIGQILNGGKNGQFFPLEGDALLILENCGVDPLAFLVGVITEKNLETILSLMADRPFHVLYCDSIYHPLFLSKGWDYHVRIELTLHGLKKIALQPNLIVKRIDQLALFTKCFWYKELSEIYGSDKNFLQYGYGYALCKDGQPVSEAYAFIGNGYAELGVATAPLYRHKGYASQIVTALIEECQKLEVTPMWSCGIDNRVSIQTALKLGFNPSRYHAFMAPPKQNDLKLAN